MILRLFSKSEDICIHKARAAVMAPARNQLETFLQVPGSGAPIYASICLDDPLFAGGSFLKDPTKTIGFPLSLD